MSPIKFPKVNLQDVVQFVSEIGKKCIPVAYLVLEKVWLLSSERVKVLRQAAKLSKYYDPTNHSIAPVLFTDLEQIISVFKTVQHLPESKPEMIELCARHIENIEDIKHILIIVDSILELINNPLVRVDGAND